MTDEDGNWYRIPAALPDVPAGAFIVVLFDGQGAASDDLDFGDNRATLHSPPGMTNIFEDGADQVALYRSAPYSVYLPLVLSSSGGSPAPADGIPTSNVVSFVAWGGDPGSDAAGAIIAGVWSEGQYKDLGVIGEETVQPVLPGHSLGLVPGGVPGLPNEWAHYQESEVTQGHENLVPGLPALDAPSAETMDSATFAIGWPGIEGATGYHFQMDNDSGFGSPEYDLKLDSPSFVPGSPVPDGKYYWRVAVERDGQTSGWSTPTEVNSMTLPALSIAGTVAEPDQTAAPYTAAKRLGIIWQLQRKDTKMVCRDGDNETAEVGDDRTKNAPWDAPHSETERKDHGINYCERASVSMLASYYGGRLSQDRIAYHDYELDRTSPRSWA